MNSLPQTQELFSDIPPASAPSKSSRKPRSPVRVEPSVPTVPVASEIDYEQLARQLEQHPDYRLLRRLQPRIEWPPANAQEQGETRRVLILDTETTGLDQSRESIIELALLCVTVDLASGLPMGKVEVYDGYEDPKKPIPKEVVALTGITDEQVRGQALDEAAIGALLEGVDLVIAHNAAFDRPFVERRLPAFANLPWACSFADIDWKSQGQGSAKLESLAQGLGLFYEAHRAEMDCHALLAVLVAKLPKSAGNGLQALLQAASQPSFALQATQAPFDAKDLLKARGYRWNAEQRVWQTRIADEALLQAECAWLRAQVYGQRLAQVQVDKMDALVKYSQRSGLREQRSL